jgi:hypothetical protein
MKNDSSERRLKPATTGHCGEKHPVPCREKHHHLPREHYRGDVNVAFTVCVARKVELFTDNEVVSVFVALLTKSVKKYGCIVPVYCFMPDHIHLLVSGQSESSDA